MSAYLMSTPNHGVARVAQLLRDHLPYALCRSSHCAARPLAHLASRAVFLLESHMWCNPMVFGPVYLFVAPWHK